MAKKNRFVECGAYLIGYRKENAFGEESFFIIDLYRCKELGTASAFVFTPQSQIRAVQYLTKKYKNYETKPAIIGTIHSHAQHNAFFSSVDLETYKRFGSKSLCFLVYSPKYKKVVACTKLKNKEILTTKYKIEKINKKIETNNEQLIARFSSPDGYNKYEVYESDFIENYYSSKLLQNKIKKFRTNPILSSETKHRNQIRTLYSHNNLCDKKLLIVGAGTIGSAIMTPLKGCGIKNITIIDLDTYGLENISRTNGIGFDIASRHEPKAFALARKFVLESTEELYVTAIAADITSLGFGFINNFDSVICLADNNIVRAYTSFACKKYKKTFYQAGTTFFNENIVGQISIQSKDSEACFCCIEPANDYSKLLKRTGCSSLDDDVAPQILSRASELAARLIDWNVAIFNNKVTLNTYKRICYYDVSNPKGESNEYNYPVKSNTCPLHKILETEILQIESVRDSARLYTLLQEKVFHSEGVLSILLKESMLIYLFAKKEKSIQNINLKKEFMNQNIVLLPREHIYLIYDNSTGEERYVQITFID